MPRISTAKMKPLARFIRRLQVEVGFDPVKYQGAGRGFDFSPQARILHETLLVAVPLWVYEIDQLRKRLSDDAFAEHCYARSKVCGDMVAEHGDALMFRGVKGQTAKVFNGLAEGIALMSFCPGGVTLLGTKWETVRLREDVK